MSKPTNKRPTIEELEKLLVTGQHIEITPSGCVNRLSRETWLEQSLDREREAKELLRFKLEAIRTKLLAICDELPKNKQSEQDK